jgi:hypothetical protein
VPAKSLRRRQSSSAQTDQRVADEEFSEDETVVPDNPFSEEEELFKNHFSSEKLKSKKNEQPYRTMARIMSTIHGAKERLKPSGQTTGNRGPPHQRPWFTVVYVLHQMGRLYSLIRTTPTIYVLRRLALDSALDVVDTHYITSGNLGHVTVEAAIADFAKAATNAATTNTAATLIAGLDPTGVKPNEDLAVLRLAPPQRDMQKVSAIALNNVETKAVLQAYYSGGLLSDQITLDSIMTELINKLNIESLKKARADKTCRVDDLLLAVLAEPRFMENELLGGDGSSGRLGQNSNYTTRLQAAHYLLERCAAFLAVACAAHGLVAYDTTGLMIKLQAKADELSAAGLSTFLYIRVDTGRSGVREMNPRFKVLWNKTHAEQQTYNSIRDTYVQVADRRHSAVVKFNDDALSYFWQHGVGNNKEFWPRLMPDGKKIAMPSWLTLVNIHELKAKSDAFKQVRNGEFPKLSEKNTRIDFGDDRQRACIVGPFTEIFGPDTKQLDMAERMETAVLKPLKEGRPTLVMGYGASGAGKTSALVYFKDPSKPASEPGSQGVVMHLCDAMGKDGWNKLEVVVHETYASLSSERHEDGAKKRQDEVPTQTWRMPANDALKFTFSNTHFRLDETKELPTAHPYRFDAAAETSKTAASVTAASESANLLSTLVFNQNALLGAVIVRLIAEDRLTSATPNNPQSSRSHVMAIFTFKKDDGTSAVLALGDFAGVENKFECDVPSVFRGFTGWTRSSANSDFVEVLDRNEAEAAAKAKAEAEAAAKAEAEEEAAAAKAAEEEEKKEVVPGGSLNIGKIENIETEGFFPSEVNEALKQDRLYEYDEQDELTHVGKNYADAAAGSEPMDIDNDWVGSYINTTNSSTTVVDFFKHMLRERMQSVVVEPPQKAFSLGLKKWGMEMVSNTWSVSRQNGVTFETFKYVNGRQIRAQFTLLQNDIDGFLQGTQTISKDDKQYLGNVNQKSFELARIRSPVEHFKQKYSSRQKLKIKKALGELQKEVLRVDSWVAEKVGLKDLADDIAKENNEAYLYAKYASGENSWFDDWWNAVRYSRSVTQQKGTKVTDERAMNTLLKIRLMRLQAMVQKHMCADRSREGQFINASVGALREDLRDAGRAKLSDNQNLVPPILPQLAIDYCPTLGGACLTASGTRDTALEKPRSTELNTLFAAWRDSRDPVEATESERDTYGAFLKDLAPCIFCVANLSMSANDPPPVAFVDTSKLSALVSHIRTLVKRKPPPHAPPMQLVAAAGKDLDISSQFAAPPTRTEFFAACRELAQRFPVSAGGLWTGTPAGGLYKRTMDATNVLGKPISEKKPSLLVTLLEKAEILHGALPASSGSAFLSGHKRQRGGPAAVGATLDVTGEKEDAAADDAFEALFNEVVKVLDRAERASAASTVGTLQFLDRAAKYDTIRFSATSVDLVKNVVEDMMAP